jgi:hypothetical protein
MTQPKLFMIFTSIDPPTEVPDIWKKEEPTTSKK